MQQVRCFSHFMPDHTNLYGHSEQDLNLPDPDRDTGAMLDSQVQKAQEQLVALRRQAEQIEKQKRELEDLSQRQEELERGRSEMIEKLGRSLTVIERESVEAERRVDHLRNTHESFSRRRKWRARGESLVLETGIARRVFRPCVCRVDLR